MTTTPVGARVRALSWELTTKPLDTWGGRVPDGWEVRRRDDGADMLVFDGANTVPPPCRRGRKAW